MSQYRVNAYYDKITLKSTIETTGIADWTVTYTTGTRVCTRFVGSKQATTEESWDDFLFKLVGLLDARNEFYKASPEARWAFTTGSLGERLHNTRVTGALANALTNYELRKLSFKTELTYNDAGDVSLDVTKLGVWDYANGQWNLDTSRLA
jgi:hypothetical protein